MTEERMEQLGERQFIASGRRIMLAIGEELALNVPAYRRELIRQTLQYLGGRAVEFDAKGKAIDYAKAVCPLCDKKLGPVPAAAPAERKLVVLA
jgi:hypothetical protein